MSKEFLQQSAEELYRCYEIYFEGNLEKKALIQAVSNNLIQTHQIVWYRQDEDFKLKLLTLLEKNSDDLTIVEEITSTAASSHSLYAAHAYPKQTLSHEIGKKWLTDATLVHILPKTTPDDPVQILAPVNRSDTSINLVMLAAAHEFRKPHVQHVMFPVGPGHWYWVRVSKGEPFIVEVFDPYNHNVSNIFDFLRPHLNGIGIHDYHERQGLFDIRQTDGYSCGYFVAAKAHELVQSLAPDESRTEVIETLNQTGNLNDGLRDCFIHHFGVEGPVPVSYEKNELAQSDSPLSHENASYLETIVKEKAHPGYALHMQSLFKIKSQIEETAKNIKATGGEHSILSDLELAYLLQAEEFAKLKP
jgi:hypothetical protein